MSTELKELTDKVEEALERIRVLEDHLAAPVEPWRFLVARPHSWRKQLCVMGRNLTVGQLVSTMHANQLDVQSAADDLELPAEAVAEAVKYFEANRELVQMEAEEERRRLEQRGHRLEPAHLSR